jgi:hypothetical protein
MLWLLNEGGSSLAEETIDGDRALSLAARNDQYVAMQSLLEEHGASMSERNYDSRTAWSSMCLRRGERANDLSSLLKVIVMLEDAPAAFINRLSPQHAAICTRGRQLRAQLPSYLMQQRAAVVAHCSLPSVLQSLVTAYAVITPEDMWTDGLRVHAPRAKRARARVAEAGEAEDEEAILPRRSLRLHQKRNFNEKGSS